MQSSEQQIKIPAPQNWNLAATLFSNAKTHTKENGGEKAPIVLISSAAGVPRQFYNNFARYLIKNSAAAVLIYDYRGMSESAGERAQWPNLRMFHWAQYDFPACAHFLRERFPNHPLVGVGHSYGGQALGLSQASPLFERFVTVATMSGYWRNLDTPYSVWFQTQIIGRLIAKTLGYVPKALAPGEAFPGPIMLDWANWIKSPNYWFDFDDVPGKQGFAQATLPYLSVRLSDDPWGTEKAISSFMQHYKNADLRTITLSPPKGGKIGHLGFFRKQHEQLYWGILADFIFNGHFPEEAVEQNQS